MNSEIPKNEFKKILSYYSEIQKKLRGRANREQKVLVRKAFSLALNAHKTMRRKNGDPFIIHPLEVAIITLDQMNLGAVSVVCALLHDTVEDADYTLQDIETMFGSEVAAIIDGLTKIEDVPDTYISLQFENFKKILIAMAKDPRVILIKLADRLHNMRTLDSMPVEKQQKITSETLFLYAPLAHRLGFYNIKSELEDLSMKYQDPGSYNFIDKKIKETEEGRELFIAQFIQPIQDELQTKGMKFEIVSRTKSIYSIWQKMTKKQIPFEEVYDLFAIRIIIDVDAEHQKSACWSAYSVVTDIYKPNSDRLRDWISTPKANGYQSLHTTVMSKAGKWVEVQIRSKQMDSIAETGFAAHWAYKHGDSLTNNNVDNEEDIQTQQQNYEQSIESWLSSIKEILHKNEANIGEMIASVKMNLYPKEIYVFTPKGDGHTMSEKSTVIDFAYEIDSKLGNYCIGAKVNNKLVPPSHVLKTGDQIEIITSKKQKVHQEWLTFAVTSKAKDNITTALEEEKQTMINQGKAQLKEFMIKYNVEPLKINRDKLMVFSQINKKEDLYLAVYNGKITEAAVKKCFSTVGLAYRLLSPVRPLIRKLKNLGKRLLVSIERAIQRKLNKNANAILLGKNVHEIKQTIAECCNPVAGDPVVAFSMADNEIVVHRVNCNEAIQLSARYGNKIVKAKWRIDEKNAKFLAGIAIKGFDDRGLLNNITGIIHNDFDVNCRSAHFETSEGLFEGTIMLYIQNVEHLNKLMERLRHVQGIEKVERINSL